MAPSFQSLAAFTALVTLSLSAHAFSLDNGYVSTLSGIAVPVPLIRAHPFSSEDLPLSRQLYELTPVGVLSGSDVLLNLNHLIHEERIITPHDRLTVNVNGRPHPPSSGSVRIFSGNGYKAAYVDGDDFPVSIWGYDLQLVPLHHGRFPGVYMRSNTHSYSHGVNLRKDIRSPPEGMDAEERDYSLHRSKEDVEIIHFERISPFTNLTTEDDFDFLAGQNPPTARQTTDCANGVPHYLEIAIAFDNSLCEMYGDNVTRALAAMHTLVDTSSSAFEDSTCVHLSLTHLDAHCADPGDPYTALGEFAPDCTEVCTMNQIFYGFLDIWRQNYTTVTRDVAYFVSGFRDDTDTAGLAFLGATCSNRYGYGWSEGPSAHVFSHEIGHTLSAQHTDTGLMMPIVQINAPLTFANDSATTIIDFVDSAPQAWCLSTEPPTCDAVTCGGECVDGTCVVQIVGSVSATPSPSPEMSPSEEPTVTPSSSASASPSSSASSSASASSSPSSSSSSSPSSSPSASASSSPSPIPSPSSSAVPPSASPSSGSSPSSSSSPTLTSSNSPTMSPSQSASATVTPTPSSSVTPTPSISSSMTPSASASTSATPSTSMSASPSISASSSMSPSPSSSKSPMTSPSAAATSTSPNMPTPSDGPMSPSPSPMSPDELANTCGETIPYTQPMACLRGARAGHIPLPGVGHLLPLFAIVHGKIRVNLRALPGALITEASIKVAMGTPPGVDARGAMVDFTDGGSEQMILEQGLYELTRPSGGCSCCGQRLLIRLKVKGCNGGTCVTRERLYVGLMRCERVCPIGVSGKPVHMDEEHMCPTCELTMEE